jgi:hypothetical protein
VHYDQARLLIDRRGPIALYTGLGKGGVFKLFHGDGLVLSDTGPTLRTKQGRVAVTHLAGENAIAIEEDRLVVEGRMAWAKEARLTPFRNIVLRTFALSIGRLAPNLARRLLQRLLVTGRTDAPFRFRRELAWTGATWRVNDTIEAERGWGDVTEAGIGGFQTSTATVMARVFAPNQLQLWLDMTPRLRGLGGGEPLVVERIIETAAERDSAS